MWPLTYLLTEVLDGRNAHLSDGVQRALGDVYELRIYTYKNGSMPEVIKRWAERVPRPDFGS